MLRRRPGDGHAHPARLRSQSLIAGLAAAALAGCGGDEPASTDQGPPEPEPLTKAQFLNEADRICFATESQIEAAADDLLVGGEEPPPDEARKLAREFVVPRLRSQVDTIRLLEPPPGDADEIERILEATEMGADQIEADPTAYLDDPPPALVEAERLARAYGSEECGLRSGPSSPGG